MLWSRIFLIISRKNRREAKALEDVLHFSRSRLRIREVVIMLEGPVITTLPNPTLHEPQEMALLSLSQIGRVEFILILLVEAQRPREE